MPSSPMIEVRDLCYRYPDQDWVLRDVNLSIYPGEFVAIIGQNGAGKTTLVKHFNGILKPIQGQVLVNGRDTRDIPFSEIAYLVGYCYQNPDHQIFKLTVREEVEFGPLNLGVPEQETKQRAQQVLDTVGLTGLEEEYPFALSRGQRQKLAVASILATNPPVMIIDEPTTGMDWRDGTAMMDLIKELHDTGRTIVMITHDMRIVTSYASRVIVMRQGQIVADGTPREIFVQTELLNDAFIQAPQITRIAQELSKYGLPPDILTVEEATNAIERLLKRG